MSSEAPSSEALSSAAPVSTNINAVTTTGSASGPEASGSCGANTVTVTEKETIYVTVGTTSASVMPIQSSAAAYYPTSGFPSASGVAGSSSSCLSTGFITIHKPKPTGSGVAAASGAAKPTGYWS